jgi:hypothetical protein
LNDAAVAPFILEPILQRVNASIPEGKPPDSDKRRTPPAQATMAR